MTVADGAGHCTRGLWADMQRTAFVEARQRPPACTDGVNVEHRHADRKLGDDGFVGSLRSALSGIHQRDVGRGAAHVEANNFREACNARDAISADDPASGTGEHRADRLARRE